MSPTGDPSTFTFTFDAFPATATDGEENVIYDIVIGGLSGSGTTTVYIDGTEYTTTSPNPELAVAGDGKITLDGIDATTITKTVQTGNIFTNMNTFLELGQSIKIPTGTTSKWVIL
jgi:phage gp45-like